MEECDLVSNILCFSKTCYTDLQNNSNFFFRTRFAFDPQERSQKSRGGRVFTFIKKALSCKFRQNLVESDEHKEILSLEISNKNSCYVLLSRYYNSPKDGNDILSMLL